MCEVDSLKKNLLHFVILITIKTYGFLLSENKYYKIFMG